MKKFAIVVLALILVVAALPAAAAADSNVPVGTNDGKVYVNEALSMTFEPGEDWSFLTDEEIMELNLETVGLLGGEYADALEELTVFNDLYAQNDKTGANVSVYLEKMSSVFTDSFYRDAAAEQVKDALIAAGFQNVKVTKVRTPFLGKNAYGLQISFTSEGITIYEAQVYLQYGCYIASVTAVSINRDTTADILQMFEKI